MRNVLAQIYRHKEYILLGLILVFAFFLRMVFLHEPFERDEGWYATIAQEILHGGIPYRDAIDQKPPGVFYLYAIGMAIFGHTTESIRIFTALYSSLTLLGVYWVAKNIAGSIAALSAAAIFAFVASAPLLQASSSNSEVFMALPLVLSALAFVIGYQRKKMLLLGVSGFCIGLAMLIKTVALPYFILLAGSVFLFKKDADIKGIVKNQLFFMLPPILLAILTILYFYLNGALHEFIYWNLTVPLKYSQGKSGVGGPQLLFILNYLKGELIFPALMSLPAAIWLLFVKRDIPSILVALLLPASCLAVLLPGMNFPHYFIQLVPFMSLLSGITISLIIKSNQRILWLLSPFVIMLFAYYLNSDYRFYLKLTPEQLSFVKYGYTFVESESVASYIKERTVESDYIFQWGFEPELYFLSQRRTPVPYISSTILSNMENPALAAQQMIATLTTKNPKYIVIQPEWANWAGSVELSRFMESNYIFETVVGYAQIYRRR